MATAPDAPRPKLILCWIINCFLWSPKFAGVQFANFIHFKCIHSDSVGFWSFQNTLFTNTTNWTEHHDPEHLMNPFTFLISNFKPNTWKTSPSISKWLGWYPNITVSKISVISIYGLSIAVCVCLEEAKHIIESQKFVSRQRAGLSVSITSTHRTRGAAVNICCISRHWISTGYLLDIPRTRCFQKISLWWPFCSIKNVTRV